MKSLKRQRGSLLIIAVVMIVIIGFLSTAITSLSVSILIPLSAACADRAGSRPGPGSKHL